MYINIDNPESHKYEVIDIETGMKIPGVQEANDETGEFSIILSDLITGEWISLNNEPVIFKFKGNIRFYIKKEN